MNFKNLIQGNSWLSVAEILVKLYPDQKDSLQSYEEVYEKLKFMPEEDSDLSIEIEYQTDDFDGAEYVSVSGKYDDPKNEEETFSQAIEFEPWKKWLGMNITSESLASFSELEIIAYCLFEMTFVGFEEEDIQQELIKLEQEMEDYKAMTDEEKKENSISLDDLFKDSDEDE